jgi:hypothetical protein
MRSGRYRTDGGLGHARRKTGARPAPEVSVQVIVNAERFPNKRVETMSLGEVARELAHWQGKKDRKEFLSDEKFQRFLALKRAYNRLSEG